VEFQLHENIHEPPAVVQHAGEREVEVQEPVLASFYAVSLLSKQTHA
jgi:hypothetical protein